uniref:Small ribosomal subunit protein mS31 n=1 Tax=Anas platyrhynchos platyrhynchos TaxID=8840 RepID=A0A493T6K2_ANAPP
MWGRGAGRAARCSLLLLTGRPRSKIQKLFSTSSVLSTEKDKSTASTGSTNEVASKSPEGAAETPKQKLLNIIGNMKVEVTSKKKFQQLKTQEIKKQATDKLEGLDSKSSTLQGAAEDTQRTKPLNRELVEAVSAVASSLPRSKEQTESELLAQLRRHEETTDKQRKGGTINIRNVISEMSIKRQSPAQRGVMISNRISLAMEEDGQRLKPERLSSRSFDSRRSLREGKRLNIFTKAPPEMESALKTVSSPTIWDLEFAKEIAAVTDQPPRNGFEEMIQWTKEGILWEFPIDNEADIKQNYLRVIQSLKAKQGWMMMLNFMNISFWRNTSKTFPRKDLFATSWNLSSAGFQKTHTSVLNRRSNTLSGFGIILTKRRNFFKRCET